MQSLKNKNQARFLVYILMIKLNKTEDRAKYDVLKMDIIKGRTLIHAISEDCPSEELYCYHQTLTTGQECRWCVGGTLVDGYVHCNFRHTMENKAKNKKRPASGVSIIKITLAE